MKIMQINSYYDFGSTGKIAKDINDYLLNKGEDICVCYAWDTEFYKESNIRHYKYANIVEKYLSALTMRITGNRYGYNYFSTHSLISEIKREKPDVVHIHCPNSYDVNLIKLIGYLNKNKIRTVITEHAEFYHTGNCAYAFECEKWQNGCGKCPNLYYATKSLLFDRTKKNWLEMKNAFEGFTSCTLVPVSSWLAKRTRNSPITKGIDIQTVINGIDTNCFKYYSPEEIGNSIRNRFLNNTVLFVTSDFASDVKGGKYMLSIAKKMKDINFIVVCQSEFDFSDYPNITHISYINHKTELAQYYSLARVTLLCSKRETFSMIVAESLCCGTPVVGFLAGGPESIAIEKHSYFSEYGDIEPLISNLRSVINSDYCKQDIALEGKMKYSAQTMANDYYSIYRRKIND